VGECIGKERGRDVEKGEDVRRGSEGSK